MAGKKDGVPISFRIDPELAERLRAFVDANPAWSQTEVVVVGIHALLEAGDPAKLKALGSFRRWLADANAESAKPKRK